MTTDEAIKALFSGAAIKANEAEPTRSRPMTLEAAIKALCNGTRWRATTIAKSRTVTLVVVYGDEVGIAAYDENGRCLTIPYRNDWELQYA